MKQRVTALVALAALLPAVAAQGAPQTKSRKTSSTVAEKPAPAPAPNILSIIPAQGEPNITVTLSGTGFTAKTSAFLGTIEVPTTVVGPELLTFTIPKLPPGLYALFLKRDGATSRTYNFSIQAPKPFVESISPDTISVCSSAGERVLSITGRNFQPASQVLFDGSVVKSSFGSEQSLTFTVPQAPGGLHQVQVKNPDDTFTTPMTLTIVATPEIYSVTRSDAAVTYYKLVIEGKNFQPGTTIVVEENSLQVGLNAGAGKRLRAGAPPSGEREFLTFVDCSKLVYQRYPADPTDKDLRIQVINPNGETSSVVQVTAP
ncbi:cell surface receptor IPT/TIG domain protein [Geobacter metallireducens RCH3]|uniref:IPT/TIG domain protein n=1 Tax=Geobacter metallireducens (strain ATCC 53774 / DSM 7210 / GS-15) TaxID=269799 RepID=Q39W91_GEOMG|nr:IPT/TIG domain-containing protein [Geobacter metallireducens]ABB31483.1 IPT/TIG domain protein [Geobacter metallireducens GS-15]EHP88428.1 cell surface receptor IPT/TIG domain protein [Geobacter metallireducens RCH3]